MKYPIYLPNGTKITTLHDVEPKVGCEIKVGTKSYQFQGPTGVSHGVGVGGPNGELPSIDSVSWYAEEVPTTPVVSLG